MSERVNGSHPLLLHISLSLSQFLCPFHLSRLFMWQQWQTKMEGRKLCSVGHSEETVWNWNEDDPPTAQSLLTLHMDMFYPGFLLLLSFIHAHMQTHSFLDWFSFLFKWILLCDRRVVGITAEPKSSSRDLSLEENSLLCKHGGKCWCSPFFSSHPWSRFLLLSLPFLTRLYWTTPRLCVCVCVCQCNKSTNCKFKCQLSTFSHLIFIPGPEQKQQWQLPFSQGVCN